MPIMLGSNYCWLNGMEEEEKYKIHECPNDPTGYFIINGIEKVVLM